MVCANASILSLDGAVTISFQTKSLCGIAGGIFFASHIAFKCAEWIRCQRWCVVDVCVETTVSF